MIGIDPGLQGGIAALHQDGSFGEARPLLVIGKKAEARLDYGLIVEYLQDLQSRGFGSRVVLEKPRLFAMNPMGAYTFGRLYGQLELAISISGLSVQYVEADKWSKEVHAGIDPNLKPKAKSAIALERLFPGVDLRVSEKAKKPHEGLMDALLIAEYGRRKGLGPNVATPLLTNSDQNYIKDPVI